MVLMFQVIRPRLQRRALDRRVMDKLPRPPLQAVDHQSLRLLVVMMMMMKSKHLGPTPQRFQLKVQAQTLHQQTPIHPTLPPPRTARLQSSHSQPKRPATPKAHPASSSWAAQP